LPTKQCPQAYAQPCYHIIKARQWPDKVGKTGLPLALRLADDERGKEVTRVFVGDVSDGALPGQDLKRCLKIDDPLRQPEKVPEVIVVTSAVAGPRSFIYALLGLKGRPQFLGDYLLQAVDEKIGGKSFTVAVH